MPDVPARTGPGLGLILGIESSCDETAAAVVRHGTEILSNVVASQVALHANYGGVVPELASREHLRNIVPVVRAAIAQAAEKVPGLTFQDLDAIAVTRGPGLAGALLVGITYAKALAFGLAKPLLAINHLEGHIHAVLMDHAARLTAQSGAPPSPALSERVGSSGPLSGSPEAPGAPILALVVSGGHTHLYLAHQSPGEQGSPPPTWRYRNIGRTVDDAAGEAFDKVAKILGLGYPGGPWIDALAPHGNPRAVPFTFSPIKPRRPSPEGLANAAVISTEPRESAANRRGTGETPAFAPAQAPGSWTQSLGPDPRLDLSFSGIKTAVLRYTQTHAMQPAIEARRPLTQDLKPSREAIAELTENGTLDQQTLDLLASFQYAVVGNLLKQTFAAAQHFGARAILVSGGVAANSELRRRFTAEADRRGLPIAFPTLALSTDNAAMIAAAAWPRLLAQDFAGDDLTATPQLRLI